MTRHGTICSVKGGKLIYFTTFVTIVRSPQEETERRLASPARVEGNTVLLPIGTDVQASDHIEHRLPNKEPRTLVVIDVAHPPIPGANDHIEVTCVPRERVVEPDYPVPALHSSLSIVLALVADGRMSEAVSEAMRLVEERVQSLTASDESGPTLMESVFGAKPPQLDITTATGQTAEDEREGFRLLFIGAMLGLRDPERAGVSVPAAVDEALECLALASMLMRRLDRAESRLG
jgi:uncharacterized protein (TIGR02391 family)